MLDGKLRIAPTCYHMLHQVPVRAAHEMNFFYDEGLKTADGSLAYELLTDSNHGRFSISGHAARIFTSSRVGAINIRTCGWGRRI